MLTLSEETEILAQRLARPVRRTSARSAAAAFDRYGKGIDPKARLNLADCTAYGLAKALDAPLLFKGEDFSHTDIQACV